MTPSLLLKGGPLDGKFIFASDDKYHDGIYRTGITSPMWRTDMFHWKSDERISFLIWVPCDKSSTADMVVVYKRDGDYLIYSKKEKA